MQMHIYFYLLPFGMKLKTRESHTFTKARLRTGHKDTSDVMSRSILASGDGLYDKEGEVFLWIARVFSVCFNLRLAALSTHFMC